MSNVLNNNVENIIKYLVFSGWKIIKDTLIEIKEWNKHDSKSNTNSV